MYQYTWKKKKKKLSTYKGLQREFWRREVCSEWPLQPFSRPNSFVCVKERQDRLPTMYWLPKLHKKTYKARFIANSSSCTTTELSKLLTSCLTAVTNHVIRYCEKVYERSDKDLFWSIKNSGEVLNKLKSRGFRATSLSTYYFSTLYTTLPNNLIKEKLINLIEWTFKRKGSPYIACNERQASFTSGDTKRYKLWSCQNVCEALIYLLDNIYIRFGTKLYRQTVGIPMGTNCAPLVADLFLFCYERDFMTSLSDVKQAEIIEAFKSTSRCLDDLLNIDNSYFEGMVNRIYPPELQLNKANTSDTETPFLDLHLSISNGFVSSKIYDKRDDFDFDIVNFPFLDGDVPRSTSYRAQDRLPTMYWLPKLHKKRIKHDLLQTQVLVLQLNFLNYYLRASLLSKIMS